MPGTPAFVNPLPRFACLLCLSALFGGIASGQDIASGQSVAGQPRSSVSYADDVAPLLRRNCYRCHGSKNQEGQLQLNLRSKVLASADSESPIVVPGQPDDSLLIARICDDASGERMPPDAPPLSDREIDVLRRWIAAGARWPDELAQDVHWAYQPLCRPERPSGFDSPNAIDAFVTARLADKGLTLSPPLDRARWLRRASLALTGLPPTPEQVKQLVNDRSSQARQRAVDRLLDSPSYGERWALPWLDLARYADSNGFQADQIRDNWAYRDWVIRSFNADKPFNEFVIEQLAGDLLPDATIDQRIATGFHRMTTCNVEAGVHPEANRVNQIVDRVNTTATVFLGTTLECCQCHDHKYDPFTQQDYYQLFAFFNNTPLEVKNTAGVTWDFYGPTMDLPLDQQTAGQRDRLQREINQIGEQIARKRKSLDPQFETWLATLRNIDPDLPSPWQPAIPESFSGSPEYQVQSDGAVLMSGDVPDKSDYVFTFALPKEPITAIRIDLLTDDSIPGKGPGRGDKLRTNVVINEFACELVDDKDRHPLALHSPVADFSQTRWDVSGAIDGDLKTGWAIMPEFGKPHWARFVFSEPVVGHHEGQRLRVTVRQHFGGGRVAGKPRIQFCSLDPSLLDTTDDVLRAARIDADKRSAKQTDQLREAFERGDQLMQQMLTQLEQCEKQHQQLKPETTLVMTEMQTPRETFVMMRGDYEQRGPAVTPGTPQVLPEDDDVPATGDRLQLARWLTSRRNPLLARVTVNRWWAEFFGRGIVETLEDFGTQSESPTHPLLLDWLATELIDSGWSMKHVHKQIALSATFAQQSQWSDELMQRDPQNQWLARGPSFRLPAELLRDNALAISGLLSPKMYGPPIMPFQPDNLWRSVGRNQPRWVAAQNEDRFRRGLYVIWKRAAPYPSFITFDAPDRGSCTVQRKRTNTPLQALTLLNDPAYAEMALGLAERILAQPGIDNDSQRIQFAFTLATARQPKDQETDLLQSLLDQQRAWLADNPDAARQRTQWPVAEIQSQSQNQPKLADRQELAAWFAIANTLLNLDETISY